LPLFNGSQVLQWAERGYVQSAAHRHLVCFALRGHRHAGQFLLSEMPLAGKAEFARFTAAQG
jgi:hypothetical protein